MNEPVELSHQRCRELLESREVGRAAVCTPSGPAIVPVNYVLDEESVVFRTTPYSVLGTYAWSSVLAFEVDHLDPEHRLAWSVVATGPGSLVEDAAEVARIRTFHDPQPWVRGSRLLYVRLAWQRLTGRSIGAAFARM